MSDKCVRCGRCCTYLDHTSTIAELTTSDERKLLHRPSILVVNAGRVGIRTIHVDLMSICCCLENVDGRFQCSIYHDRPTQCRDWKYNSALCRHYRRLPQSSFPMLPWWRYDET